MAAKEPQGMEVPVKYSEKSWEIAGKYAALLGQMPSSFSSAIRTTRSEIGEEAPDAPLKRLGKSLMRRLVRSPALKAPIYFAAQSLYPAKFQNSRLVDEFGLMAMFGAKELSSLVGLIYLCRRAQRIVGAESFEPFMDDIHRKVEMGAHVGRVIERIGADVGIVLGATRHVAFCSYMSQDEKGWKGYQRLLKSNNSFCDFDYELQRWGCTHVQVASCILQAMGYGRTFASGISFGIDPVSETSRDSEDNFYKWYIADVWTRSLVESAKIPDIRHRGSYYPMKEEIDPLMEHAKKMRESNRSGWWLNKRPEDLPTTEIIEATGEESQQELEELETEGDVGLDTLDEVVDEIDSSFA